MSDMSRETVKATAMANPFDDPQHLANTADAMSRACGASHWQRSTAKYHAAVRDTLRAQSARIAALEVDLAEALRVLREHHEWHQQDGLEMKLGDEFFDCASAYVDSTLEERSSAILGLLPPTPQEEPEAEPFVVRYRNYRGEVSVRTITPKRVWYGSTEWHHETGWLLTAYDHDKKAERDFALADFNPPDKIVVSKDSKEIPIPESSEHPWGSLAVSLEDGMEVIRKSYGWTIMVDGTVAGLVAGDMGYDATHITIPRYDLSCMFDTRDAKAMVKSAWEEAEKAALGVTLIVPPDDVPMREAAESIRAQIAAAIREGK